jgi:PAS domain S-box-containing protein
MGNIMHLKLRHKINGAIIITFLMIAVIFSAIQLPFQKHRLQTTIKSIEILLQTLVDRDLEQLANEIFDSRLTALKIRIKQMQKVEEILAIAIFNDSGKLLLSDGTLFTFQDIALKEIEKIRQKSQIQTRQWQGHSGLLFSQEIYFLGENLGFIQIYYSLADVEQNQKISFMIFGSLLGSILLVMLIVLNLILSKAILQPIRYLSDATQVIAMGNLEQEINMPRKDELGNLAKSFENMRDAIKEKISDLHRLQNYLSNVFDSMPSVLVGVDKDENITQWNTEAMLATGITSDKAVGQPLTLVFPQLSNEIERVRKAIQTRKTQFDPKKASKKNGETRYEDITVYPLISNGVEGAVIRVDDITEKIRLEEMMVQSEKMLSVGGLAAGMAHEINNPLAGMMQSATVMSNRLIDVEIPANQLAAKEIGISMDDIKAFMENRGILRMAKTINDSGQRVAKIVDNMLNFARKTDALVSSHNPVELLDKILELASTDYDLKKQYDFKAIEIQKEYEKDLPALLCEGAKIQQVLLNILRNGAQAMQARMEKNSNYKPKFILRMSFETKTNMLCMEIEDNGPGMDKKTCKRIFEPFFTTKPIGVGTGLGLSVSYFIIVENHNGEMNVESTPGVGTKFIIHLPLKGK